MALYLLKYVSQFLECSVRNAIMVQGGGRGGEVSD